MGPLSSGQAHSASIPEHALVGPCGIRSQAGHARLTIVTALEPNLPASVEGKGSHLGFLIR